MLLPGADRDADCPHSQRADADTHLHPDIYPYRNAHLNPHRHTQPDFNRHCHQHRDVNCQHNPNPDIYANIYSNSQTKRNFHTLLHTNLHATTHIDTNTYIYPNSDPFGYTLPFRYSGSCSDLLN
jgi:hypothetical protein